MKAVDPRRSSQGRAPGVAFTRDDRCGSSVGRSIPSVPGSGNAADLHTSTAVDGAMVPSSPPWFPVKHWVMAS
jgi:hypothetical protein